MPARRTPRPSRRVTRNGSTSARRREQTRRLLVVQRGIERYVPGKQRKDSLTFFRRDRSLQFRNLGTANGTVRSLGLASWRRVRPPRVAASPIRDDLLDTGSIMRAGCHGSYGTASQLRSSMRRATSFGGASRATRLPPLERKTLRAHLNSRGNDFREAVGCVIVQI
jgi:hypothetical protein